MCRENRSEKEHEEEARAERRVLGQLKRREPLIRVTTARVGGKRADLEIITPESTSKVANDNSATRNMAADDARGLGQLVRRGPPIRVTTNKVAGVTSSRLMKRRPRIRVTTVGVGGELAVRVTVQMEG